MMRRRPPLLLALPTLLGLLHTAALAQAPPEEVAPRAELDPTAPDEVLGAILDELAARVQRMRQATEAAAQLAEALMATGQRLAEAEEAIAAEAAALGQQLAAARDRLAELEAARAEDGAMIARLQAELEDTRAEARALGERLEESGRGLERLNAALAAVMAEFPRAVGAGGGEADRREATGVGSSVTPPAAPAAAPPGARSAGDGAAEAPAEGAEYYAATEAVNLRAAPTNAATVLAVVDEGDVVRGVGREGLWLRVEHGGAGAGGVTGWVYGRFLRRVDAPPPRGGG